MGIALAYDTALHPIVLPRDVNDGFPSRISGGRMTQIGRRRPNAAETLSTT
jgi:hypothetical protein